MAFRNMLHAFAAGLGLAILLITDPLLAQSAQTTTDEIGARRTTTNQGSSRNQAAPAAVSRTLTLFISGTVAMGDATPIPTGVTIERNCGGQRKRESYVDANGAFAFQVGSTGGLLPDAGEGAYPGMNTWMNGPSRMPMGGMDINPLSFVRLTGCELRASLAGYRSSTVILEDDLSMGQLNVGTIILYPVERITGTLVSLSSLKAPKKAKNELARAQKEMLKKNLSEAERHLKIAVDAYPDYAAAWFELGQIQQRKQQFDDARSYYLRAVGIDPKYVAPHIELARLAALESKWREAEEVSDHALELDPLSFPEAYLINSIASYHLNQMAAAERSALQAQRLDVHHRFPQASLVLANILNRRHDWIGEAEQLRIFLKLAPEATDSDAARSRLIELEKIIIRRAGG